MSGAASSMTHPGQMPRHRRGKHIGNWPVIIAGGFAAVIMLGVIYGGIHRLSTRQPGASSDNEAPSIASTGNELQEYLGNQQEGFIDSRETVNLHIQNQPPQRKPREKELPKTPERLQKPEISAEEKALLAYREQQIKLYLSALTADTNIKVNAPQKSALGNHPTPTRGSQTRPAGVAPSTINTPLSRLGLGLAGQDPNKQNDKLAFIHREPSMARYLGSGRQDQLFEYEIKTGTLIPAVMISGLNSDLPGTVIGQVSHE